MLQQLAFKSSCDQHNIPTFWCESFSTLQANQAKSTAEFQNSTHSPTWIFISAHLSLNVNGSTLSMCPSLSRQKSRAQQTWSRHLQYFSILFLEQQKHHSVRVSTNITCSVPFPHFLTVWSTVYTLEHHCGMTEFTKDWKQNNHYSSLLLEECTDNCKLQRRRTKMHIYLHGAAL